MTESDELIREFLIESHEGLDRLDQDLVDLEKDPRNRETLARVFRAVHTMKGTCGFLGFSRLEAVSHVGESLLSRLRDGELLFDGPITDALLGLMDAIREILASIESTGTEGDRDYSRVIAQLHALNDCPAADVTTTVGAEDDRQGSRRTRPTGSDTRRVGDDRRTGGERRGASEDRRGVEDRRPSVSDSSLRVDVGLVDMLMGLVGELVLARDQIVQFAESQTDQSFLGATRHLNLITSALQKGVMRTRMQPIGIVWSKFPRIVRDLAALCGKQVRIDMEGRDTELDKTIIEAIKDPLTHIIRNAIDHGIEAPQARVAAGKSAEGLICLRAFHEGDQIHIEISDDGAGIDPDRVRQHVVSRGLLSEEDATRLADHEALTLIFTAGVSTADTVTHVSGRGVGMDVVKTNIERIGGVVDIQSHVGLGATLRMRIPQTPASGSGPAPDASARRPYLLRRQ